MNILYGLVGYPLGHSFSEKYFSEKFRTEGISGAQYRNFPLRNIGMLKELIAENPTLKGFNVTIPYKEQIMFLLDETDVEAAKIGAVNCVSIERGRLTGFNTDAPAFRESLLGLTGIDRPAALILGSGGASKAVHYVLYKLGMDSLIVSRKKSAETIAYDELDTGLVSKHRLIINTTPLGMYPDTKSCPDIPYNAITPEHYLFDLVYNPTETEFMKRGKQQGAHTINGYDMLVGQAERSWQIWKSVK